MRDPNKLNSIESGRLNILKIQNPPPCDYVDWDLNDDREMRKYIQTVERTVRQSFEYTSMIAYLRENLNMNSCSFFENVSNSEYSKVRIEIHHDPLSLFDIASIVTRKRLFFNENMDEELTAMEIMLQHYETHIGLIPLSETVHQLVHNRYLFIPTDKLFGHYKTFVNMYSDFITPEQKEAIDNIEEATKIYSEDQYKEILDKKFMYVDFNSESALPYAEVKQLLESRVQQLEAPKPQITYINNNKPLIIWSRPSTLK